MPTNKERREVARKLREKYRERNRSDVFTPQDVGLQARIYLEDLVSCVPDGDSLFTVLADLIEPEPERTCAMEYCDEWSGDELYPTEAYTCSICGYIELDGKTNYCSNCGAKVIEE